MKRIYVGNLPYSATADEVRELFEQHGTVQNVDLINDRETGQPRGFGFVEMGSPADAEAAIAALDGKQLDGRTIKVNIAQERTGGGGGGGGGGFRGGGGGGGGRGGGGRGGGGRGGRDRY